MRTINLALIALLMIVGSHVSQAQRVANSPDGVVRELYRVHNGGRGGVFGPKGKRYIYKFFDQNLADLIWKDITQTPQDEVGNLDFDPLYNAQDMKITRLLVGKPVVEGDESTVIVSFRNFGQLTKITFKLQRGKEGWKISNVIYGDDSDLIKILSSP